MSNVFTKFATGVKLVPNATTQVATLGDIDSNTTNNKLTFHNGTSASPVLTEAHTASVSNKTLDDTNTISVKDTLFTIENSADTTKKLNFSLTNLTTATTANLALPVFTSDTLVTANATQTLTNKTFSGGSNTITGLTNANLSGSAGITNANLAVMPTLTIKGNNTGGSAVPLDLTVTQVHTMLGDVTTIGSYNGGTANANALTITGNNLFAQSASATNPGMVDTTTQIFAGAKTFNGVVTFGSSPNLNGQTITNTGSLTLPTSTDTLVGRATTDTLTNKTFGDAITMTEITKPANPAASSLKVYAKADNNLYTLNSAGVETQVGSGSGGSKNYLSAYTASTSSGVPNTGNGNAELGTTTGWTLGTTGTLTNGLPTGSPTFGSGAAGTLALSVISSGQLAQTYSFSYASSGSTTSGNMMASDAFFIDAEDQAKVLGYKFSYKVQSGAGNANFLGTNQNSFAVAAYDVTNSTWFPITGQFGMNQVTGVANVTGTFQTATNTAQIRFVIYNNVASSGAVTLYFDSISVGPQISVNAPTLGDWTAYTPTLVGFGTPTSVTAFYKIDGDSVFLKGKFVSGTSTAVSATITLPTGMSFDSVKAPSSGVYGKAHKAASSTSSYVTLFQTNPGDTFLTFSNFQISAANNPMGAGTGSTIATSGDIFVFDTIAIPITGKQSNSVASSDTDTRVVAARATNATASLTGSLSDVTWTTVTDDTHGAFSAPTSTVTYFIPVAGYYDFSGQLAINGTATLNQHTNIDLVKNGSVVSDSQFTYGGAITTNTTFQFLFNSIKCNAGDAVKIQASSGITSPVITSTATDNFFQIKRISGPAIITATESVNMRYTNVAATSIVNTGETKVPFATRDYDSHNAWATDTFTAPISGKYSVKATVGFVVSAYSTSDHVYAVVYKNGSPHSYSGGFNYADAALSLTLGSSVATTVNCLAGDTIQIFVLNNRTGGATALSTTVGFNHVEIERVGN